MTEPNAGAGNRRAAWRHGAAAALLLAITLLFFSALFEGRTYSDVSRFQRTAFPWGNPGAPPVDEHIVHYDQAKSYYPWQALMSRSYRGGEVPLWNPYSFAGHPFLAANANNALYPPRIALSRSRLSPSRVRDVFAAGHMFLAGLTMYLLLAYFRTSFAGALLGAVSWMASSFMIAWVALEHFVVVAALLPLAVLLADASIRRRSWPAALALGPVLALLFLGGNVLFVELCFVAVGAYAAGLVLAAFVRSARRPSHSRGSVGVAGDLARFAVPWLLFAGLSAVVLLPTAELVDSMSRAPVPFDLLRDFALPRVELKRLFLPPNTGYDEPFHHDAYHTALFSGTAVGVLALVGVLARRPGAWFARVLAAVTILVALGTVALALPYLLLPGFDNFKPLGRVLFLAAFAIAILAAFGLDLVLRALRRSLDGQRLTVVTALVEAAAIVLTVGQLRAHSTHVMHAQEPTAEETYPATPMVQWLGQDQGARFVAVEGALPGSTALVYPLRNAAGYESIVPGRVQDFWRVVGGLPADQLDEPLARAFEPILEFGALRSDLLWRAGIAYVAAPPDGWDAGPTPEDASRLDLAYEGADGRVFRVRDALPRAYFTAVCDVAPDSRAALVRFQEPGFDPRATVIVEPADSGSCGVSPPPATAAARIVEESVNTVTVEVDAPSSGFLVLNDTWDPGWRATVGGEEVDVLPANALFRAVPVEAGAQTVEFRYSPTTYEIGRVLSLATLVLLLGSFGVLVVRRLARQRNPLSSP